MILRLPTPQLYAKTLVVITQIWAPTVIRITVDPDDDELDLNKIVHRDENGIVIGIDLPERAVMMANHQVSKDIHYCLSIMPQYLWYTDYTILLVAS